MTWQLIKEIRRSEKIKLEHRIILALSCLYRASSYENFCISVNFSNISLKLGILDTYIFQNITKLKNRLFQNFILSVALRGS